MKFNAYIIWRFPDDLILKEKLNTNSTSSQIVPKRNMYAAAVYLRYDSGNWITCNLISAKSKLSPLRRVTILRLELCGAVLATQLLHYVYQLLKQLLSINAMHAWIQSSPHRWATFIANRISQILSLTPLSLWRYVPTSENTMNCTSRRLYPTELLKHPM